MDDFDIELIELNTQADYNDLGFKFFREQNLII